MNDIQEHFTVIVKMPCIRPYGDQQSFYCIRGIHLYDFCQTSQIYIQMVVIWAN